MKKFINLIVLFSVALFFASPISAAAADLVSSYPILVAPAILGIGYGAYVSIKSIVVNPFTFGAVEKEIWSNYIADNLFRGYEWLRNCYRADQHVLAGKVVHIPQAGAKPTATKNPSSFPLVASRRTDTDVTYSLDEYVILPTVIENAAEKQLSYDKMESVLGNHMGVLSDRVGDEILVKWSPTVAGSIIRTTGATTYTAHMPAATGTRKGFTIADLKKAKVTLTKMKVPAQGRFAVMSEDMWSQLEDQLTATSTRDYSKVVDEKTGAIAKLYGFDIIVVAQMTAYDNAGTPQPKAYGAAGAITDNDMVLCYQKDYLELAMGSVDFFESLNDPYQLGDVYASNIYAGGRIRYNDQTGVVAIVQAP